MSHLSVEKNIRNSASGGQREKTNLCGSCLIIIQFCLVVFPKSIAQGFPGLLPAKMFLNWAILKIRRLQCFANITRDICKNNGIKENTNFLTKSEIFHCIMQSKRP